MKSNVLFAFSVASFVGGCSSNNTTNTNPDIMNMYSDMMNGDMFNMNSDMLNQDMATVMDPVKPAIAATQIDRMGRATINVALTNPFDLDYTAINGGTSQGQTRAMYNQDSNQAGWVTAWKPTLATTLAIYDGVDTKCGNQLGACALAAGCPTGTTPMAGQYDTLASVLADDQIYMDTTKTDCSFYLAVEAAALSIPGANTLCGGRTPLVDVVDVMYTSATVGISGFPVPPGTSYAVGDSVNSQSETPPSLNFFPFLSDPD